MSNVALQWQTKMPLVRVTMTKFLLEINGRVVRVKRLVLMRDRFINRVLPV